MLYKVKGGPLWCGLRRSVRALECVLISMAILAPPLMYFGSLWLLGFGHGTTLFYQMYEQPFHIGFVIPSLAALLVALSEERPLLGIGLCLGGLALFFESKAVVERNWDMYTLRNIWDLWPLLVVAVGVIGPITSAASIFTAMAKIVLITVESRKSAS